MEILPELGIHGSDKVVARRLKISPKTIQNHIREIKVLMSEPSDPGDPEARPLSQDHHDQLKGNHMGKAEERKEPTFPLSYWNDAGDVDLGPMPDRLKRPEQFREEQARKDVASMAQTAVNQVVQQEAGAEAQPKSQQGKTRATQEAAPPQPEAPPAKETQALTLGQESQAKYPLGVTLHTDLDFEEFAYYVDYVRQVRELRNRAAGNRPSKRQVKVATSPPALR